MVIAQALAALEQGTSTDVVIYAEVVRFMPTSSCTPRTHLSIAQGGVLGLASPEGCRAEEHRTENGPL